MIEMIEIQKNNEIFLIKNNENDQNLLFWKNIYSTWENETFSIFDEFLDKNKIFIDIGGWIGTTSMYGSRNSKYVYIVEANNNSCKDMKLNLEINCNNNYEIINKVVYNIDNIKLKFGKNTFLDNSKINDSTSQIYENDEITDEFYIIETITVKSIIENNNININEISLIKLDIAGGEENILNDIYEIYKKYNIPLYVSFHYTRWKDSNLDRFEFLTEIQKNLIIDNPFTSILFS
jgi:FkbM family methyltransferase